MVASVKDNQLLFDQDVAATWTDDISKSCKVELFLVPSSGQSKTINSGDKLEEAGTLQLRVLDEAGNSSSAEIKLTLSDTKAPEIVVKIAEKNVVAGVKVKVEGNQLFFDDTVAATWKDDYSETFTTELYLFVDGCEPETINIGDVIAKAGVFKIHVIDQFGNKSIAEISLTAVAITGLENLQNLSLQVDKEVNLLQGLTIAEGLSLVKVEIEQDGTRSVIPDATKYIPEVPGAINIILTLSRTDGSTIEVKVDNLTIQGIQYQSVSIIDIKPVDVFPQIAQIEAGDPNIYSYVEDLRVAEAYVMREMMGKYGAGNYSPEEYQQLLSRINIGLINELSDDYANYEWI